MKHSKIKKKPISLHRYISLVLTIMITSFVGIALINHSSAASGFAKYETSDPDYPQKVDFVVTGDEVKTAPDDPIVYPGKPGAAHDHTFGCNLNVDAFSTAYSLWKSNATKCNLNRDHAAYWIPSVYADGVKILPYQTRFYYRAGTRDVSKINTIPFGLRIIAGDAKATSAQPANIAGFQCRNLDNGNTVPKQSLPPDCPVGDFLEPSIIFPNCWDGKNLDSSDHKSHMAYSLRSGTYACPPTHPVQIPQLTVAYRYNPSATSGKTVTLASMMPQSQYTLHADFINAWDPAMLQFLIDNCIKESIACETISNTRMVPGKTPPPPTVVTDPSISTPQPPDSPPTPDQPSSPPVNTTPTSPANTAPKTTSTNPSDNHNTDNHQSPAANEKEQKTSLTSDPDEMASGETSPIGQKLFYLVSDHKIAAGAVLMMIAGLLVTLTILLRNGHMNFAHKSLNPKSRSAKIINPSDRKPPTIIYPQR